MSSADRLGIVGVSANWLRTWPQRYGFAVLLVAAATLVRYAISVMLGPFPPFAIFVPAIILAAVLAGFGPGLLTTLLSAASVASFFWTSLNVFGNSRLREVVGLILFCGIGTCVSALATLYRRHESRLLEFERVVEGLEEMIVVVDRDYRYLIANQAFLKYRGMKRDDVIGRRAAEVLSPGVFESTVKEKLDECFRGKIVRYEMRYTYPTRGERELVVTYFPIEGPDGVDRVASVLQDVTDQQRAERSLKLFRTLIDQSNDAVEVVDPETLRFLDVNQKACKDLGYTREELLAMSVFDIDPTADESCRASVVQRLQDSGPVVKETLHRRKDGSTFPVETSLKFVQLDRSYVVTVSRDISDRKRAENAARESEDRYRDLVEHSEDLVCTHDLNGNLLSVNPAPARTLGYEISELLKISMRELIAPEYREQFDAYLHRIRTNGADRGVLCVVTRNGQRRIWEYNNTLRTEGVAEPIVRGMAHDITERKLAEIALRTSEQRYRLLFEKNIAGVALSTLDGKILDCNAAWARMLGYDSVDEIRGRQTKEFYFNNTDQKPLVDELRMKGAFLSREVQLRRRDGTPVWVLFDCLVRKEEGMVQATAIDITKRKQVEDALRLREQDYRTFVAQSSEGIFREDLDAPLPVDMPEEQLVHHIIHDSYMAECNDAIARMYGFASSKELLGKRLTEMLVADDPRNLELTREYIRSGFRVLEPESHEVDVNGNPKVFRNSMIGIVENGKLLRTWGIQRDVTEQVKLESDRSEAVEALRKSEEHFRILVEQAPDGIFLADAWGRYVDVNSAGAEMLGYTREEILQLSLPDVLAAEEVARLAPEVARFTGGQVIRSDWKFRRKDGSTFPGEVVGKRLPDGRLQGILRDMTERQRTEEEMRRSEERFRVALKDSPITVFNQDRDLRYTWIYNPQLYWQHGVVGKTDEEIIGAKKAAGLNELKRRVLKTGTATREEVAIPQNGKSYVFDMSVEPLFDAEHKVVGITCACSDIAGLREAADRLQEAKDRLAQEKVYLEREIQTELGFEEIIGQSSALRDVLKKARIVAPTDSTVLLLGETGTGKELVARDRCTL